MKTLCGLNYPKSGNRARSALTHKVITSNWENTNHCHVLCNKTSGQLPDLGLLKNKDFLDCAYRVIAATSKEKDEAGFLRAVAGVGWQPPSWFAAIALLSRESKKVQRSTNVPSSSRL
jgi:hypothetical protein